MQIRITSTLYYLVFILSVCSTCQLVGQDSQRRLRSLGIGYYGELALHPGIQADITIELADNSTRRFQSRKLLLRPSLIYFHRPYYTHNYMVLPDLLIQIEAKQGKKLSFYFEVSAKAGYLRYQYVGDQFIATPTGIQSINRQGGDGFVYGLGVVVGVKTLSTRSYYLGLDYLNEQTEDSIRPNLIGIKVGVRFDKTQSQKSKGI